MWGPPTLIASQLASRCPVHSNPKLRTLARGLSPGFLRFGGTSTDFLIFDPHKDSTLEEEILSGLQAEEGKGWMGCEADFHRLRRLHLSALLRLGLLSSSCPVPHSSFACQGTAWARRTQNASADSCWRHPGASKAVSRGSSSVSPEHRTAPALLLLGFPQGTLAEIAWGAANTKHGVAFIPIHHLKLGIIYVFCIGTVHIYICNMYRQTNRHLFLHG